MIDIGSIRAQFPVLNQAINGKRYAFLDSGASSQMPQSVIDAIRDYHETSHANIHRGAYKASVEATERVERVRRLVRNFIGARRDDEIIFTSGATDSLNLVAQCWGRTFLRKGDVVLTTIMEHHAHIVPWQEITKAVGARLVFVEMRSDGRVDLEDYYAKLKSHQPKLVTVTHMSNALGTINPIETMVRAAHEVGALVSVDAAQSVPHMGARVADWDVDFLSFSAHKMCGPTGVGVLFGKKELLEKMPPYRFGGDMILRVSRESSIWNELPFKFEAGTPNISGIIGLGAAIDFLNGIGFPAMLEHERALTRIALEGLRQIPGMEIYGIQDAALDRAGVIAFNLKGIHPHDVGTVLDTQGVAMRVGHHCAQPLMDALKQPATVRMSLYVYSNEEDLNQAFAALRKTGDYFRGR